VVDLAGQSIAKQNSIRLHIFMAQTQEPDQMDPQEWSRLQQSFLHIVNRTKRNCYLHKGLAMHTKTHTSKGGKTMPNKQTNGCGW